jgi:hypothetical protein
MLSPDLQLPFQEVFDEAIAAAVARAPRRTHGPGEVGWLEAFHTEVGSGLDHRLRRAMREAGVEDSVRVQSAFVHGNPFQILPETPVERPVEAGDLLVVGERYEGDHGLVERQALLLQMKVGEGLKGDSTLQQALLYGAWPPVNWSARVLRALPGAHPRTPHPGPTRGAQFGIIPARRGDPSRALELLGPGSFSASTRSLGAEMAAATRLAIGVDATPDPADGWPRIVQDMLERSLGLKYGKDGLPRHSGAIGSGEVEQEAEEGDDSGGFTTVVVSTGPVGILD